MYMGTTNAITQLRRLSRKMAQNLQESGDDKEHLSSDDDVSVADGPLPPLPGRGEGGRLSLPPGFNPLRRLSVAVGAPPPLIQPVVDVSSGCVTEQCGNLSRLMSGIIAVNTLILGAALVSATAYSHTAFSSVDLQIYLIILALLSSAWMLYYILYTSQKLKAVLFKDRHAGPVWLRAGLVAFGVLSLIMDIFKISNYVGYLHCESAVKVVFPIVQVFFIFVQTYFLWFHAKDCVELQWNLTRCGLMLVLSTNLILWMNAITEESIHQTGFPEFQNSEFNGNHTPNRRTILEKASYGEDHCKCSHYACKIIKQAYYYLYPFNIEYSLFASAMVYVMWKNVGRLTDSQDTHHHIRFHGRDILLGPIAGIILVIAGLTTFVVYEVEIGMEDPGMREHALMMHFVVNIVAVLLMSALTMVGVAIHMLHAQEHASGKNPARSLDVGLLIGASMGQFTISYFTIVAEVGAGVPGHLNALNLTWAVLTVVQVFLQNMFIIEGLTRLPYHEPDPTVITVITNPCCCGSKEQKDDDGADLEAEAPVPAPEIDTRRNTAPHVTPEYQRKLAWKRRILKEVCAFLLCANVLLWIMPAFGARPQFDHYLEHGFYQFSMWAAVVNIGLPFGVFYRMHSVAGLFEVYLTS